MRSLGSGLPPPYRVVVVELVVQTACHLKHVFVIMLENHGKDSVIGDPNTPYITSLANTYGLAADYYGVTHPSEPNYVAMIAGDNFWINNDNPAERPYL